MTSPPTNYISHQQTKGYYVCPSYGPYTNSKKIRGLTGEKIVYLGKGNDYLQVSSIEITNKHRTASVHLFSIDILRHIIKKQEYLDNSAPTGKDDPITYIGVKRQSILYILLYSKVRVMFLKRRIILSFIF
jgi:hypothetical protein